MNTMLRIAVSAAALFVITSGSALALSPQCTQTNEGRTICMGPAAQSQRAAAYDANSNRARRVDKADVRLIPNPSGCSRTYNSCACRLAAYLGLGGGLDAVKTWPKRFARAHGPGIGLAAIRHGMHHIMGITGGGPGAWEVVDFNSGRHQNHAYKVANFNGYFFVDPRVKLASR